MPTVQPAVKMWSRTTSDASVEDNFRKLGVGFQEAYQIVTSYDATAIDVYNAEGLPRVAEPYPGTSFVLAKQASLQRLSPILWIATCSFEGEIGGGSFASSPLVAPPRITWDDVETEEEIDEDFDGNLIVNTAGDRIRGVKALFADQVLTVTRNFATFNTYAQAIYRRSVNSDLFMGWPAGTCKLMKLSASNVLDQNFGYWQVTGVFQFRYPYRTTPDKAWYARTASMGFYQKLSTGGRRVPCEVMKEQATTPQPLDADGLQTTSDNVAWIETKRYGSLPYNALGLI